MDKYLTLTFSRQEIINKSFDTRKLKRCFVGQTSSTNGSTWLDVYFWQREFNKWPIRQRIRSGLIIKIIQIKSERCHWFEADLIWKSIKQKMIFETFRSNLRVFPRHLRVPVGQFLICPIFYQIIGITIFYKIYSIKSFELRMNMISIPFPFIRPMRSSGKMVKNKPDLEPQLKLRTCLVWTSFWAITCFTKFT